MIKFQRHYFEEHLEWIEDVLDRIVFCAECKKYQQKTEHTGKCEVRDGLVAFDDFCSDGIVKEN